MTTPSAEDMQRHHRVLEDYLILKVETRDRHGIWDAAIDLARHEDAMAAAGVPLPPMGRLVREP